MSAGYLGTPLPHEDQRYNTPSRLMNKEGNTPDQQEEGVGTRRKVQDLIQVHCFKRTMVLHLVVTFPEIATSGRHRVL